MKRSKRRKWLLALMAIVALWTAAVGFRFFTSRHDYDLVLRGQKPRFALSTGYCKDGGTIVYSGIGYELTALCSFHVENGKPVGYDRGPILRYHLNGLLLPLSDKQEIRLDRDEERFR